MARPMAADRRGLADLRAQDDRVGNGQLLCDRVRRVDGSAAHAAAPLMGASGEDVRLERLRLFGQHFALSWAVTAGDVIYVTGMTGMEVDFTADVFAGFVYPAGHEAQM